MSRRFQTEKSSNFNSFKQGVAALCAVLVVGQLPAAAEPADLSVAPVTFVSDRDIKDILKPAQETRKSTQAGDEDKPAEKGSESVTVSGSSRRDRSKVALKVSEGKTDKEIQSRSDEGSSTKDKSAAAEKSSSTKDKADRLAGYKQRAGKFFGKFAIKPITYSKSEKIGDTKAATDSSKRADRSADEKAAVKSGKSADSDSAGGEDNDKTADGWLEQDNARVSAESKPAGGVTALTGEHKGADARAGEVVNEGAAEISEGASETGESASEIAGGDAETAEGAKEDRSESKGDGAAVAMKAPEVLEQVEESDRSLAEESDVIVIDNDEVVELKESVEYSELPTDGGKTKIRIGARFPVVISSQITSKTAKKGDPVEGRLKYDLKIGGRLIAKRGSVVRGHLNYSLKARTILHSLVSPERWYRNSGCLGIEFDEIISHNGEHIPCKAAPARQGRIVKNKAEGRELGVNHYGQVTGPWAQQLRYKAVRIGLNFALAPAGVFSFGAMPVALGVIGAANPNFAFAKPVGLNVRHRRIKGFAWGFLSGIPGSWLIEDTTVKGQEAIIKPGDEFLAAFTQEFTGEPDTDASILSGASTNVKGQVVSDKKTTGARKKK